MYVDINLVSKQQLEIMHQVGKVGAGGKAHGRGAVHDRALRRGTIDAAFGVDVQDPLQS